MKVLTEKKTNKLWNIDEKHEIKRIDFALKKETNIHQTIQRGFLLTDYFTLKKRSDKGV